MAEVVQLQGISKSYRNQKVLENVSLSLDAGKFYALLGRNGAGKSTLMRILMRYDLPDGGSGSVLGHRLDSDPWDFNLELGYVSEAIDYALPLSIQKLFASLSGVHPRWNQSIFDETLRKLRLDSSKRFGELSRGQKMQVAFAAAIATRPRLLLLDEITAVLDANARGEFMEYLGGFVKEGGTVLMATNIVTEVHHYADHVILVDDGRIRLDVPLSELSKNFLKIRKAAGERHPLFESPECVRIGLNSDGSETFVLPVESVAGATELERFEDRRALTVEEAFVYFTRGNRE